MLISLVISIMILFPKLEPTYLLRWSLVPLSSYHQTRYNQYHKWRCHFSIFPLPSQLPRSYSLSGELVHSRFICFELSAFASMVKAFHYCRESVGRKILYAAPVDTFYWSLIISFLSSLWASMGIYIWFCSLHNGVWLNYWSANFAFLLLLHPSKGVG